MESAIIKINGQKVMQSLQYRIKFEDQKIFTIRQRIAAVLFRFAAWVAGVKLEFNISAEALKFADSKGLT